MEEFIAKTNSFVIYKRHENKLPNSVVVKLIGVISAGTDQETIYEVEFADGFIEQCPGWKLSNYDPNKEYGFLDVSILTPKSHAEEVLEEAERRFDEEHPPVFFKGQKVRHKIEGFIGKVIDTDNFNGYRSYHVLAKDITYRGPEDAFEAWPEHDFAKVVKGEKDPYMYIHEVKTARLEYLDTLFDLLLVEAHSEGYTIDEISGALSEWVVKNRLFKVARGSIFIQDPVMPEEKRCGYDPNVKHHIIMPRNNGRSYMKKVLEDYSRIVDKSGVDSEKEFSTFIATYEPGLSEWQKNFLKEVIAKQYPINEESDDEKKARRDSIGKELVKLGRKYGIKE